jgi:anthranilate phosphoribosyltransferase
MIRSVYSGQKGAPRDVVLANAGACFYVTGRCATLQEGVKKAADLIDSGLVSAKLEQLVQFTGEISHVS